MDNINFEIKLMTNQNISDVVKLHHIVFGSNFNDEYFKKKMSLTIDPNFHFLSYIAYHQNIPVSFFGMYASNFLNNGRVFVGAQSGDVMTRSDYQRKGLFRILSKVVIEECEKRGVDFLFAFPNKYSFPGFIKHMRFESIEQTISINLYENKFNYYRLISKNNFLNKLHEIFTVYLFKFLLKRGEEDFSNSNSFAPDSSFYSYRSKLYYQSKSKSHLLLKIKGKTIWFTIRGNRLDIGDLEVDNISDFRKILSFLKLVSFLVGIRFISFGGSKKAFLINLLLKEGFSNSIGYNPVVRIINSEIQIDHLTFLNSDADVF